MLRDPNIILNDTGKKQKKDWAPTEKHTRNNVKRLNERYKPSVDKVLWDHSHGKKR